MKQLYKLPGHGMRIIINNKAALLHIFIFLIFFCQATAQNYTLTSNADTHAASPTTSAADGSGFITLRSAMEASTQIAGTHIITIPPSITVINLTLGQITVGNPAVGNNITVNGPGKAVLTINQTTVNRIFSTGLGAVSFTLTNLTMNYAGPVGTISGGGGAVIAGGVGANTTFTNVAITNFNIQIGNGGGMSCSTSNINNLTLTNCDFINNYCGGGGGGVSFNGNSTCIITNCKFINNQTGPLGANTGGGGGALSTTGSGSGGTYTVTNCTFTNNHILSTGAQGGAIINTNGILTVNFCRFVGNTAAIAANGNTIVQTGGVPANTINSNNNWWGQNAPTANDNVVVGGGSVITCTKWLQLKLSASPSTVCTGNGSTVTASFLSNSASEALTTGNVSTLIGLPISFVNPVLGTYSAAQANIQASGTATVTYTAGAIAGTGSANAVVDNLPSTDPVAKVSITVIASPAVTSNPAASTLCSGLPASFTAAVSNQTSMVWQESADAVFTTPVTLTNTGIYSGVNTTTLSISNNATVNGRYYRLSASNASCGPVFSTAALLTATAPSLSANNTVTQAVNTANNNYYAAPCAAICKVVPSGASPVTGNVTVQVWVESSVQIQAGKTFVQRHYQVTPATAAATATATVTLYFLQVEFDNFNASALSILKLPAGPADAIGKSNLRVAKYAGSSGDGTGLPPSYSSGAVVLDPVDANIVWNAGFSRWEVTVDVVGFSGFIVQTSLTVIPVKLLSFTARLANNNAVIDWKIAQPENAVIYTLQRSENGSSFIDINYSQGDNTKTQFTYIDPLPASGKYYYRLMITDIDGRITYSNIVYVRPGSREEEITIYPNPVQRAGSIQLNLQNISANKIEISNVAGQVIYTNKENSTGNTAIALPVSTTAGIYFIRIFTADKLITKKITIL